MSIICETTAALRRSRPIRPGTVPGHCQRADRMGRVERPLALRQFTVTNLPARLAQLKSDPWADLSKIRQSITATMLRQLKLRPNDR